MSTPHPLLDRVVTWARSREWNVDVAPERGQLILSPSDGTAPWPVVAVVREDDAQVLFLSLHPRQVPEAQRPAVAEALTRANFGLLVGNLELDYADGEVRCRTGIDVERVQLDDEAFGGLLDHLLGANLAVLGTYLQAIEKVATGQAGPADAIAEAER